jgi:hypothetical protein
MREEDFHSPAAVNVLLITLIVSLCLTGLFVAAFLSDHLRRRDSGPERDSLLPLDDPSPPQRDVTDSHPS